LNAAIHKIEENCIGLIKGLKISEASNYVMFQLCKTLAVTCVKKKETRGDLRVMKFHHELSVYACG